MAYLHIGPSMSVLGKGEGSMFTTSEEVEAQAVANISQSILGLVQYQKSFLPPKPICRSRAQVHSNCMLFVPLFKSIATFHKVTALGLSLQAAAHRAIATPRSFLSSKRQNIQHRRFPDRHRLQY